MMKIIVAIVIAVVIIILFKRTDDVGHADGFIGAVSGDFANAPEAAERLQRVNDRIIALLRGLRRRYDIDAPTSQEFPNDTRRIVDVLLDNYNYEVIREHIPTGDETSYTINKGDAMYLCMRDRRDPRRLIDEETMFFVVLHEAAHIANYKTMHHDTQYWATFKFLIHEAAELGLHQPRDYARNPVDYCGLNLNWSPYFDAAIPALWKK